MKPNFCHSFISSSGHVFLLVKRTFGLSSNFFYNLKEPLVLFQVFFVFNLIESLIWFQTLVLRISKLCLSIFQKKVISMFASKPNPILPSYG